MEKEPFSNLRCNGSGERGLCCYDCGLDDYCPFTKEGRATIDSKISQFKNIKTKFKHLWKRKSNRAAGE